MFKRSLHIIISFALLASASAMKGKTSIIKRQAGRGYTNVLSDLDKNRLKYDPDKASVSE